jgi:hypothetical protein
LSVYEKSISVRQILKVNKIDINLLNWMTWSLETCKELKRLCIRVTKKRAFKFKKNSFVSQYSSFSESFNSEVFTESILSSLNTIISDIKNSSFQSNDSFMIYSLSNQYRQFYQTSFQAVQNWNRETNQRSQFVSQLQQASIMSETLLNFSISQSIQHSQTQFTIQSENQSEMQSTMSSQSQIVQSMINAENVLNVKIEESNIRFLRSLKDMKRAFRIKCTVTRSSKEFTKLRKFTMQADQESNMNIMTKSLRSQLRLSKNKLTNIEFHELFMRTTDHRDIYLKFWTKCSVAVEDIMRMMRCFISLTIFVAESSIFKYHSLLLRLSWLFSVNAVLTIREFKLS